MPIQTDGKMGYSTAITIDQANQFTSKTYVDTASSNKVAKAGDTMTGALILSGDPVVALGAATKQYIDNKNYTAGGITEIAADAKYFRKATDTLNDIGFPLSSYSFNAQKLLNITDATTSSGVVSKSYIDTADSTLQTNLDNGLALKYDITSVDNNFLSKTGLNAQTVNSTVTMAAGKKIVQPFYATQTSDVTNKQYVDD